MFVNSASCWNCCLLYLIPCTVISPCVGAGVGTSEVSERKGVKTWLSLT